MTGLLDLGHDLEIFSDARPAADAPIQPQVADYKLVARTTYMDMPSETAPWEMPVRPVLGKTWPPGSVHPVHNMRRIAHALPLFFRCLLTHPGLTRSALQRGEYGYQAESLSILHRLARLSALSRSFHILHAHFGPVGNSFRFARALWHAPFIVSFHGFDFSTIPRKQGPAVYRKLFQTADAITVNSDYTRKRIEDLGCPASRIRKLPVGVDLAAFPFRPRRLQPGEVIRIVTVARLVEIKGHEYALKAIAQLKSRYPAIRYDIVGDGPLRPSLETLAAELGIAREVHFHGAQDTSVTARIMAEAHLSMLTSVTVSGDQEGQGLALQEAQASGLPVVATNHGALPEGLLPGRSGLLVPERNPGALAGQIAHLIEGSERWPAMGEEGRRFVEENYDHRKLNSRLVEIYRDTIDRFGTRSH
jgi:colanic acid/amylovoran biosynthesis glycosyltransferase